MPSNLRFMFLSHYKFGTPESRNDNICMSGILSEDSVNTSNVLMTHSIVRLIAFSRRRPSYSFAAWRLTVGNIVITQRLYERVFFYRPTNGPMASHNVVSHIYLIFYMRL